MGLLPQDVEIIFEVHACPAKITYFSEQGAKIARRKISFSIYKMCFFFFPSLWTPTISKSHNFLIYFKRFKVL